jgi:hypothetical protein
VQHNRWHVWKKPQFTVWKKSLFGTPGINPFSTRIRLQPMAGAHFKLPACKLLACKAAAIHLHCLYQTPPIQMLRGIYRESTALPQSKPRKQTLTAQKLSRSQIHAKHSRLAMRMVP